MGLLQDRVKMFSSKDAADIWGKKVLISALDADNFNSPMIVFQSWIFSIVGNGNGAVLLI